MLISNSTELLDARLNLLHFQLAIEQQNIELAIKFIDLIKNVFENMSNDIEIIRLPNQLYCPFIDPWIIANEMELVNCLRQQSYVEQSILNGQFDNIDDILKNYQKQQFECQQLTAFNQLKILLEFSEHKIHMENGLNWCEMGLYNVISKWMKIKVKNQQNCWEFAQQTHYLINYLRDLLYADQFGKYVIFFTFLICTLK